MFFHLGHSCHCSRLLVLLVPFSPAVGRAWVSLLETSVLWYCLCLNNLMFPPLSSRTRRPLQEAQHTCLSREMIFPWLKWMISVCLRVLELSCLLSLDEVAAVKAVFACVYGIQCRGTSILLPSGRCPGSSRSLLQAELSSRLTNGAWEFPKKRIYVCGPYNLWMTQGLVLKSGKV